MCVCDPWAIVHWIYIFLFVTCWLKPTAGLDNVYLRKGRRPMASLTACQTCSPAKDLQPSQAGSHHAHRAKKRKPSSWHLGSWNVHSMGDTEGPVEIASSRRDGGEGGDRKVVDCARDEEVQCEGDCTAEDQMV